MDHYEPGFYGHTLIERHKHYGAVICDDYNETSIEEFPKRAPYILRSEVMACVLLLRRQMNDPVLHEKGWDNFAGWKLKPEESFKSDDQIYVSNTFPPQHLLSITLLTMSRPQLSPSPRILFGSSKRIAARARVPPLLSPSEQSFRLRISPMIWTMAVATLPSASCSGSCGPTSRRRLTSPLLILHLRPGGTDAIAAAP